MDELTFELIKASWEKLKKDRVADLKRIAPNLSNPGEIYMKRMGENNRNITIQFAGFNNSTDDDVYIPQIKRLIVSWLRNVSVDIRTKISNPDTLLVQIDKESKIDEAVISIFKRDPKTNKKKNYFKCIGGIKNGRKVKSPDMCLGVPDFDKKLKFKQTKHARAAQVKLGNKKTQLTNITSRRIRKANMRLKKARGF